ncbi:hypothetical protein N656DRAFT_182148 [Canariomyces notabilis]|uniref:Uncharacterized protein n=1 Tax=Canariomyces notabilis TaxID=2074819 RepID=A0AAN6QNX5_9PEZI|nr:hypothetical protein N656DRAFT_182148 [Canariomyces arenarius]
MHSSSSPGPGGIDHSRRIPPDPILREAFLNIRLPVRALRAEAWNLQIDGATHGSDWLPSHRIRRHSFVSCLVLPRSPAGCYALTSNKIMESGPVLMGSARHLCVMSGRHVGFRASASWIDRQSGGRILTSQWHLSLLPSLCCLGKLSVPLHTSSRHNDLNELW